MVNRAIAFAVTAGCLLLAACGHQFWSGPTSGSTPVKPALTFALVIHDSTAAKGSLASYIVNSSTGVFTETASEADAGTAPVALAVHPGGKFVYVADRGGRISGFSLDGDTGKLTALANVSMSTSATPTWMGVTPDGNFLYVTATGPDEIAGFKVDSKTGAIEEVGQPATLPAPPQRAAIAPIGRFVYVALGTYGTELVQLAVDGTPKAVKTFAPDPCSAITAVVLDSQAHFAFAADAAGGVCNYALNSSDGSLSLIAPTMNPGGRQPTSIAIDSNATALLTANNLSNDLTVFNVAPDGSLSPMNGSPASAGLAPSDVALDANGAYAYVTNTMTNSISVFKLSGKTVKPVGTITTGSAPKAIAIN